MIPYQGLPNASGLFFLDQRHYAQLILKAERGNNLALDFQLLHHSTAKERRTSI